MNIVRPGFEIVILDPEKDISCIERAARLCYKSEAAIREGSAERIIRLLIENGHEAMLEHSRMSVIFTVDRGVSHELVRHRLASFAQESTRYCNYSKDKFGNQITVIEPIWFRDAIPEGRKAYLREYVDREGNIPDLATYDEVAYCEWYGSCKRAEDGYFSLLMNGRLTPEKARNVLPTSLKTEIMVTANYREWRKIFQLRTAPDAHPEIRGVMTDLLEYVRERVPVVFDDIP